MSTTPLTQSVHLTLGLLLLFVLALFPGLPQYLLCLPLQAFYTTPKAIDLVTPVCPSNCVSTCTTQSTSDRQLFDGMSTSWFQKAFALPSKSRGSYLITDHVVSSLPEIKDYKVGLLHLFIQHTSCALSLNENWDSDVREDMSDALDRLAPEDKKGNLYRHSAEGPDDMPAHIKSLLAGASVSIPISNGRLATGTWQGIWYLEFRTSKHSRKVVATIQGEKMI